jgi:hypothetical protein
MGGNTTNVDKHSLKVENSSKLLCLPIPNISQEISTEIGIFARMKERGTDYPGVAAGAYEEMDWRSPL